MDYTTIKDRCNFLLDNNDAQSDNSFSAARLRQAINWAYRDEVRLMHSEGTRDWLVTSQDITWESGEDTYTVPEDIRQKDIIEVRNITDDDPGDPVVFGLPGDHNRMHWKDRNTLQWGTDGPGSDQTIRFVYYPAVTDLVEDSDVPELVPEVFHELIALSAATFLLEIADREAPQAYLRRQEDMRLDLAKFVSKARPNSAGPGIYNADPDADGWGVY